MQRKNRILALSAPEFAWINAQCRSERVYMSVQPPCAGTVVSPTLFYQANAYASSLANSRWNFMKLQHHFHILLSSRSRYSRTRSMQGLQ